MPDVENRITRLEERSDAHLRTMEHLRGEMSDLSRSMDSLRGEMTALGVELRGEMAALRRDVDRRFSWLVGLQVATLATVVAALVGASYR